MNKNAFYNKVPVRILNSSERFNSDIRAKPQLLEKSFMKNRIKYRKYFSAQQVSKFEEISTLNICDGAKQIYPKKQKNLLRRDILRILVAVIPRFDVKKVSFFFKISPPVYLHVVKIDII